MRSSRSLIEVLFPKVRAEMLRLLFSVPLKQRYLRELTNMSGLALCTVQDELRKLAAVGLIHTWTDRKRRFSCANRNHPLFRELLRFVEMSDRLPRTKHAVLHRPSGSGRQKKRKRRSNPTAAINRPPTWGIFSRPNS